MSGRFVYRPVDLFSFEVSHYNGNGVRRRMGLGCGCGEVGGCEVVGVGCVW